MTDAAALRIRAVGADETSPLHAIRLRALRENPEAFGSTYEAEVARDPESRRRSLATGVALIAEDAHGWHGLAGASREEGDDRVEIVSMWVTPERRGQGIGTALLRAALDWARARGAAMARIGVVEGNETALSLYRSHGFVATGDREPLVSDPSRDVVYFELSLR